MKPSTPPAAIAWRVWCFGLLGLELLLLATGHLVLGVLALVVLAGSLPPMLAAVKRGEVKIFPDQPETKP